MPSSLDLYRDSLEKLAQSAPKISSDKIHSAIITHMLRFLVRGLEMNSAYICRHDFDKKATTVVYDYVDTPLGVLSWNSDIGESYSEEDMGGTTAWLYRDKLDLRIIYVDDLPEDDPERLEYEPENVSTVVLCPLYKSEKLWGFVEIWDQTKQHKLPPQEEDFIWFASKQIQLVV